MLGSKNTILPILSNTQTHTHTHTLNSVGDVFPVLCMVQGDESTSLKYKVGLQGFTERTFLSIVNPWMKGLHIKLAGLSSMLLKWFDLLKLPIHYLLINVKIIELRCYPDWPTEFTKDFFSLEKKRQKCCPCLCM